MIIVLKWIHGCGWVHRDISAGNLYLYDGRGVIGDLEYAKRRNSDVVHEHRIVSSVVAFDMIPSDDYIGYL